VRGAFREYCAADPQWARAVAFLDRENGAGWALLDALVNARPAARPAGGGGAAAGGAGKSLQELSDEEVASPSPPSRTRLVPPSVLNGHVSSLLPY